MSDDDSDKKPLTSDINEYRKNYYQSNKKYLLEYSKFYYLKKKFKNNKKRVGNTRSKTEYKTKKKTEIKNATPFRKEDGVFIITF